MTGRPVSIRDSRLASLADERPATTFFAFALGISWTLWLPLSLQSSVSKLHIIPGGFGPAIAAVALTWLRGESVRAWLHDGLDWRVSKRWYAVALGLPVLASVVMGGIFVFVTGDFAADRITRYVPMYPIMLVFMVVMGGGQEEFGWRGVALPALQDRFDALTSSVVIGVVWAAWHLPLFVLEIGSYGDQPFPLYAILVVGFAIIFTWLFNNTDGSILLAMVLHGGINTASGLGGAFVSNLSGAGIPVLGAYAVPIWLIAGAIVIHYGRQTLTAGSTVPAFETDRRERSV
ncbi:CPBP family intramembrane glutamic endopeptidase [Haloarcula sp. 1CSR25-25]|uniref:CPBP family intramembrane glutamic endopeptidase n=1 Tax=Haloarcula sp. 1CSR25-25 TaxID=2862545 RepID=UPI00289481FA|nr:CPBP family intramembrane glutamic endopeptidase [Haloarcula sp. 1CSR25-25]MDT3437326.1 CPBP family intramembrane metalloprotease [Haloarcula sp. 1CSR25-25]